MGGSCQVYTTDSLLLGKEVSKPNGVVTVGVSEPFLTWWQSEKPLFLLELTLT